MELPPRHEKDGPNPSFSNSFLVGFNAYVFIVEFGMKTAAGETQVHSRVATSPADAQELSNLLAESLRDHAKRFGPVKKEEDERLHGHPGRY